MKGAVKRHATGMMGYARARLGLARASGGGGLSDKLPGKHRAQGRTLEAGAVDCAKEGLGKGAGHFVGRIRSSAQNSHDAGSWGRVQNALRKGDAGSWGRQDQLTPMMLVMMLGLGKQCPKCAPARGSAFWRQDWIPTLGPLL